MSTIYRSFHNKTLSPYAKHFRILTYQRGWRKNHKRGNTYKGCRTIHERSKTATDRKEFGHWELDGLAFSRKETQSLAVFVERQTGYAITVLLPNQQSETMKAAIVDTFKKLPPDCRKTLTADRGKEFEQWKAIEAELPGTTVYFCDPARPQQKGTVENLNGLLRQYYPKNKKTLAPSAAELSIVQVNLNNRPRKRLCYATPYQMFFLAITK
jgi:IS30 family transposase